MTNKFAVAWNDMMDYREFKTFGDAERFARKLVETGKGKPRDVEIVSDSRCVATVDKDALDRVWTDMK